MFDDEDYVDEIDGQDPEFEDIFYQSNKLDGCILEEQDFFLRRCLQHIIVERSFYKRMHYFAQWI